MKNKGQALITLLFFMIIALIVTTASIVIMFTNSGSANIIQQTDNSYYIAESGMENAILRLIRDPNYRGETLSIGDGSATVQINGSNPYTLVSVGQDGNFKHTIQVSANYTNDVLNISDWKEIY